MDIEKIKELAQKEIQEEDFRLAINEYKIKLRKAKWWHRLFPFKIVVIRREKL